MRSIILGMLALAAFASLPLYAQTYYKDYECNLGGDIGAGLNPCPSDPAGGVSVSKLAATSDGLCNGGSNPYCGARSIGTALSPIDAWSVCRWVDNSSTNAYFVPFKTSNEWIHFLDGAPEPSITVTPCALPNTHAILQNNAVDQLPLLSENIPYTVSTVPSDIYPNIYDNSCQGNPPASNGSIAVPQVYGRIGLSLAPAAQVSQSFECHNGATSVSSLLQWTAINPAWAANNVDWLLNALYSPDVLLTADGKSPSETVSGGATVTLSWNANPVAGTVCKSDSNNWSAQGTSGTVEAGPLNQTTTFSISCTGSNGLTSQAIVTVNVTGPTNGVCGSSNGQTFSEQPQTGLCSAGNPSNPALISNQWAWTCSGVNGGSAVNCAANSSVASNGVCGPTNGATVSTSAPTSGLCAQGDASNPVSTGSAWDWQCSGANGGQPISCSATICDTGCFSAPVCTPVTTQPLACGSAAGGTFSSMPTTNLCSVGVFEPDSAGDDTEGNWTWWCYDGCNSDTDMQCSATGAPLCKPLTPAPQCGSDNNGAYSDVPPDSGLCQHGTLDWGPNPDDSGVWQWACFDGCDSNTDLQCTAQMICDCGAADHGTFSSAPTTNLCNSGTADGFATTATGWSWTCGYSYCSATKG